MSNTNWHGSARWKMRTADSRFPVNHEVRSGRTSDGRAHASAASLREQLVATAVENGWAGKRRLFSPRTWGNPALELNLHANGVVEKYVSETMSWR